MGRIEIPVFMTTFGFMLTVSVSNNLLLYRICYETLHFNKTECAKLGFVSNNFTKHLEELVEPTATYITLVKTIVESIFGSILGLLIAPWSDRFGRKPAIVVGFIGGSVAIFLHIIFATIENLTPWFLLVTSIPVLLTGGGISILTILTAYLVDTTSKETRGLRIGIFDITLGLATLLGNSLSSYLLIATNYVVLYCVSLTCHLIAIAYTVIFIPESLRERETENLVAGFFSISNLTEMLKTPFKLRENSKRAILLLLMGSMFLSCLTDGSGTLFFYFLREKLQWTLVQFTWFSTVNIMVDMVGAFFVVYFMHTVLKIREPVLILVGVFFAVGASVTYGFASQNWQIYLGALLNVPSSSRFTLLQSFISKLVCEEEVAKILTAFSIGSTILAPLSSAGYTNLYNATIQSDPGLFNFVTSGITFCCSMVLVAVVILEYRSIVSSYSRLEGEPDGLIVNEDDDVSNSSRDSGRGTSE
ncbi:probable peptidoglycan muropeptide transporter SLC46 [Euwallacea fornicatus]|uniref:probable peptidoglycan muropeptide transporter SLC46 n=1 Tax=Euwallacea fornicatus TaxID=995702 RepID=UPI00338F2AC7